MAAHPTHLEPSELGTKDYWETFYARTLTHISSKRNTTTSDTPNSNRNDNNDNDSDEDEDDEHSDIDADSDPGTSWFSEHNAPEKVLQFLTSEEFPLAPVNTSPPSANANASTPEASTKTSTKTSSRQPRILDLGTGNGSMLALLRKRGGFRGEMVGVDYSARSVELARELQDLRIHSAYLSDSDASDSGEEEEVDTAEGRGKTNIRFEEWDILRSNTDILSESTTTGDDTRRRLDWFPYADGGFDIVLDKGTFDAVSLSDETVQEDGTGTGTGKTVQRRVCETYPGIVRRLVRKGGFVVVTSCNWTEEELIAWFTRETGLTVWGRVEYPRFRFGGMEGQGVCTVCFQRIP